MRPLIAAAILVSGMAALPALAHDHDWPLPEEITIDEALEIARADGLVLIREIDFDDGRWEVEGRNDAGHRIEIRIDGASGEIVRR